MSDIKAKMHQIRFRMGLRPRPRWGAYSAPHLLDGGEEGWLLPPQDPHPRSQSFGPRRRFYPCLEVFPQILAPDHHYNQKWSEHIPAIKSPTSP